MGVQQFDDASGESQGKLKEISHETLGKNKNSLKSFLLTVVRSQMIDMAKVFFQTSDTHGHIDLHI